MTGPPEPVAVGVMQPGARCVQSYLPVGGNGCPWDGIDGAGSVTVIVEGSAVQVPVTRREAFEVNTCEIMRVGSAGIRR